jgi:hypothetical protein
MRRTAQRAIKPLLFVSFLLFGLTLIAPWMWHAIGSRPLKLTWRQAESNAPAGDREPVSVLKKKEVASRPIPTAIVPASTPAYDWELHARNVSERPAFAFPIAPQPVIVEVLPPVTELISLDPSLADSLELPTLSPAHPMPKLTDPSLEKPMSPEELEAPLPPPPIRKPALVPPASIGVWPFPARLMQQIKDLTEEFPSSETWGTEVLNELDRLTTLESFSDVQSLEILRRLHELANDARQLSVAQQASRERTLRLRAGYSLLRRLVIWEQVAQINQTPVERPPAFIPREDLIAAIGEMEQQLHGLHCAEDWRRYLKIHTLVSWLNHDIREPTSEQRALAREILARLDSPRLNQMQYDFVSSPAFRHFMLALIPIAQESINWRSVLEKIERHEAVDQAEISNQLAGEIKIMRWSHDEQIRCLARVLNDNYRNANVRVAISDQLINRFMPTPEPMAEDVVDEVRGAQVVGRSEAVSKLRIVLVPDRLRWRLGLEARGQVASETESVKGPARFWNDGLGEFHANKEVTVDRRGMKIDRAQAAASAESYLKDFETNYDSIPLFGSIARSIARQQYEKEQPFARFEIEHKISQKAGARLDEEVERRLSEAEKNFQEKFLAPLERLSLEPTPVQMETTANRLICRYRMAGQHQLSAHTPRPQAPGDSLLSMQLHQTLMNNVLENLKLDDQRIELSKLYVDMLEKFESKNVKVPEDLPENVTVHFAKHDAVRIACEDGRLKLTIRLQELNHADEQVWKNFEVHGYYVPSDNQQEANLVREGNLELSGARLRLADQVALRGIFAKVLSKNRTLSLVNKQLLLRKELSDLQVTQFVIQDGWIGIALGPKASALANPTESKVDPHTARHPVRDLIQRWR